MEPGVYYMHDTYVEVIRPVKAEPIIEYDSVGNVKDLGNTDQGHLNYLLASFYTDTCSDANIKNHPDTNHIELKSGQVVHVLYYEVISSLSCDPLPIPRRLDPKDPTKVAYVDWVALGDIDHNGVLAEKLFFDKSDLFAFLTRFIKANDELQVEAAVLEESQEGDFFRIVGVEREATREWE